MRRRAAGVFSKAPGNGVRENKKAPVFPLTKGGCVAISMEDGIGDGWLWFPRDANMGLPPDTVREAVGVGVKMAKPVRVVLPRI